MDQPFDIFLHWTSRSIEVAGVLAILIGAALATVRFIADRRRQFHLYRSRLGRSILLGLELLVAADIIATVSLEPTLENVLVLGGIVLIRTVLSISLQVETEGRWPWQARDEQKSAPPE